MNLLPIELIVKMNLLSQPTELIIQQLSNLSSGADLINVCLTNKKIYNIYKENKNRIVYNVLYNKHEWLKPKLPFDNSIDYTIVYSNLTHFGESKNKLGTFINAIKLHLNDTVKFLVEYESVRNDFTLYLASKNKNVVARELLEQHGVKYKY